MKRQMYTCISPCTLHTHGQDLIQECRPLHLIKQQAMRRLLCWTSSRRKFSLQAKGVSLPVETPFVLDIEPTKVLPPGKGTEIRIVALPFVVELFVTL